MARGVRFLGLLCVVAAGLLFLPWGAFAFFAAITFNAGGSLWSHPAVMEFMKVEAALAGVGGLLASLAALGRRAQSSGDK